MELNFKAETDLGHFDDVWDVQVGGDGGQAPADEVGLVSLLPVHLPRVLLRVHRHRTDAQLRTRPEHTDGYLTCTHTDTDTDTHT